MASRDEAAKRCMQQRINEVHYWNVLCTSYIFIQYKENFTLDIDVYVDNLVMYKDKIVRILGAYHCSDSPLFWQPIIPTTHYSDSPLFRQPIIPTSHYRYFIITLWFEFHIVLFYLVNNLINRYFFFVLLISFHENIICFGKQS